MENIHKPEVSIKHSNLENPVKRVFDLSPGKKNTSAESSVVYL